MTEHDTHTAVPMDSQRADDLVNWAMQHADEDDALEARWPELHAGFAYVTAETTRDNDLVIVYAATLIHSFIARQNWADALAWLGEAVRSCERTGDAEMLAMIHTRLGLVHCLRGIYQPGYDEYARAVPLLEQLEDRAALATVEGNLGLLALVLGNTRARAHLERSVMLSYQAGTHDKASSFVEHALVLLITRGDDTAARLARTRLQTTGAD